MTDTIKRKKEKIVKLYIYIFKRNIYTDKRSCLGITLALFFRPHKKTSENSLLGSLASFSDLSETTTGHLLDPGNPHPDIIKQVPPEKIF